MIFNGNHRAAGSHVAGVSIRDRSMRITSIDEGDESMVDDGDDDTLISHSPPVASVGVRVGNKSKKESHAASSSPLSSSSFVSASNYTRSIVREQLADTLPLRSLFHVMTIGNLFIPLGVSLPINSPYGHYRNAAAFDLSVSLQTRKGAATPHGHILRGVSRHELCLGEESVSLGVDIIYNNEKARYKASGDDSITFEDANSLLPRSLLLRVSGPAPVRP